MISRSAAGAEVEIWEDRLRGSAHLISPGEHGVDHVKAVTRPHRIKQDRVSILGARVLECIGGCVKGRFAIMIVEHGRRNMNPG